MNIFWTGILKPSVSFCNAAPLLISDFFSAPLAKQKETRYNMTERTESVCLLYTSYLRFTRDAVPQIYDEDVEFTIGKAHTIQDVYKRQVLPAPRQAA